MVATGAVGEGWGQTRVHRASPTPPRKDLRDPSARRILLVAHPTRRDAHVLAAGVAQRLDEAGVEVVADERARRRARRRASGSSVTATRPASCELVCVLGGDGTILRAAEISRGSGAPLLGVNLGHVGFLAEAERENLDDTVDRIVARDYTVEERMTLDVSVSHGGVVIFSQLGPQRGERREGRPGPDDRAGRRDRRRGRCRPGAATASSSPRPTGSTAYALSAGGPVIWPDVEAMLARPDQRPCALRQAGRRRPAGAPRRRGPRRAPRWRGVVACDGRRASSTSPRARASGGPVRRAGPAGPPRRPPFTDRLVAKFDLSDRGLARPRPDRAQPRGRTGAATPSVVTGT